MGEPKATERDAGSEAASPTRKPIEDFDPELSALVRREFPHPQEIEEVLLGRFEKG